jgi:hypothetical protein
MTLRPIALFAALALPLALSGCYVRARGGYGYYGTPQAVYVDGQNYNYQPMTYEGNAVYYDDDGIPYYTQNGNVYWVPQNHPSYNNYVTYYGRHRNYYHQWHRRYAPSYRAPVVYHTWHPRYRRR